MHGSHLSRVPWGINPSLAETAKDVGIDYEDFLLQLKEGKDDQTIANKFNVAENVITHLRYQFRHLGLDSIQGQD
ncbi:MAG: helix-turn-helix domain-containing protein [Bacillota bacterium]